MIMKRYLLLIVIGLLVSLLVIYGGYRFRRWWRLQTRKWIIVTLALILCLPVGYASYRLIRWWRYGGDLITNEDSPSNQYIGQWLTDTSSRPMLKTDQDDLCDDAPFILPSEGFIGLLWRDSAAPYSSLRRHTGIDIFGDGAVGTVPVVAVYDGYLTREADWKSTVIIRHDDPLHPGRTIWTYYTHMANRAGTSDYIVDDFPKGTYAKFVKQGTLLGYQGEYAGTAPGAWIAMHVHLSIVEDGPTGYLNEAVLDNTIDPSPYFDLTLNIDKEPDRPIRCAR
jgi:peptidoglycan LD-endopeptidase LytH